jgi:hypothetical protein
LPLCAEYDGFLAYVAASSCPHGWIPAFAGMTHVGVVVEMQQLFRALFNRPNSRSAPLPRVRRLCDRRRGFRWAGMDRPTRGVIDRAPEIPRSDPAAQPDDVAGDEGPSQRPCETLTALAARLGKTVDKSHRKRHYAKMVEEALACNGVVLIAWQHEDIALTTKTRDPGISQEILTQTGTAGTLGVPPTWPGARYDLVFVFDRPSGTGPIMAFTLFPQQLLSGDLP